MSTTTGASTAPGKAPPGWFAPLAGVLIAPGPTLAAVARGGRGFEIIILLLLLELGLVYPAPTARAIATISFDALGGLASLYRNLLAYALVPGIAVFALGVVGYYALRPTPHRVELWGAVSAAAYAYTPHVLVTAAGVVLGSLGVSTNALPYVIMQALAFAPVMLVSSWGWRTLTERDQKREASRARTLSTLAGAVLLVAGAGTLNVRQIRNEWTDIRPVMPSDALPAFTLASIDDGAPLTHRELAGHVALIDFWATWCGPCVAAMPGLVDLHKDLGPRGLRLVSVNTEHDSPDRVRAFVRANGLPFPVYVDNGSAQFRFRVSSLPTAVLVDKQGHIRHVHIGVTSTGTLRREIEALLVEAGPSPREP